MRLHDHGGEFESIVSLANLRPFIPVRLRTKIGSNPLVFFADEYRGRQQEAQAVQEIRRARAEEEESSILTE